MAKRAWLTAALLALVVVLLAALAALRLPAAHGQVSEGQAGKVIAIASSMSEASNLLYVIDTSREVILVYALRGVRSLSGLRPLGPGSSEEEYKRLGE
mgnify:CR=1 FL=1